MLYLYGADGIGKIIAGSLVRRNIDFSGFIVSDGRDVLPSDFGRVYYLKELPISYSQAGVIFALNGENKKAVKEYLQKNRIEFGSEYRFL
jgi:hypothetical protein